jgi:cardiolipin synthase A/B
LTANEHSRLMDLFGQIRLDVIAPLGLIVATLVTAHVLLNKRDIGASLGWIGLAWLAPIVGGFIYFTFGINRVQRRAMRFRGEPRAPKLAVLPPGEPGRDDDLAPLEATATRITQRLPQPGNTITMLQNGDAAYPPMLDAIAAATRSIGLSSYILRDDEAGGAFIDALIAAGKRGVSVRVLIDGIGSGYFISRAFERLRHNGIPVARFMHSPLPWRMPFLNLRTHKKILVVDGRLGFTGGMNISAQNLLRRQPRHPVRDTHFRVAGPVVAQLVEAFTSDWDFITDEDLEGPAWFPELDAPGEAVARVITSGPDQDLEKIAFIILQALACARRSIQIMTPYFLPNERLITALSLAAMRGVVVDIVLPARSDHILVDWAARANMEPLVKDGCRVWQNPPPFDHSKILLVDGIWCMIGSANWDVRSLRLNFELNMEFYHSDLAAKLGAVIEAAKGRCLTESDITGRSLPVKLRDAGVRLLLPYL